MTYPAEKRIHPDNRFIPDAANHRLLRNALGCFGTGVTIVTAASQEGPAAITANSFSSVSLTPPLVLWSIGKKGSRYTAFTEAEHYSIHVLNMHQKELCMDVACDATYLKGKDVVTNDFNVPILDDSLTRFDCKREAIYDAGDHVIILGRVLMATHPETDEPLVFYRGNIGTFSLPCDNAA
jgi:flavin reductase (DIM6/NTAB) family NADH-FMN oxidoreductase RutF